MYRQGKNKNKKSRERKPVKGYKQYITKIKEEGGRVGAGQGEMEKENEIWFFFDARLDVHIFILAFLCSATMLRVISPAINLIPE